MSTAKEQNCLSYLQILYAAVTTKLNKASGMRLNIQNTIKTYLQLNKISEASQGMPAFCCAYEHELALLSLRNSITFSKAHVSEMVSNSKCPPNLVLPVGSIVYASDIIPDLPNLTEFIKNLQKLWGAPEIQLLRSSQQVPEILKHLRKRDSFTLEEQHAFAHHIENNLHFDCTWFYQANPINEENSPERVDHVILSGRRISLPPSEPAPEPCRIRLLPYPQSSYWPR